MLFNVAFVGAAAVAALMLPADGRSSALVVTLALIYAATARAGYCGRAMFHVEHQHAGTPTGGSTANIGACAMFHVEHRHSRPRRPRSVCAAHHSLSAATAASCPSGPFSSRSSSRCW